MQDFRKQVGLIFEGRESRGERERLKTGNAKSWDEPKKPPVYYLYCNCSLP